jgi:hypothetical protein
VDQRADGNPFFVEELVNSLIESGELATDGDGCWHVSSALDATAVPSTIRGVIAARIDRLDPTRRRVLQEASVVGREFLYRIVHEVSGSGDELAPSLAALERADLIREKAPDPDLEYLFKHALTQEVAYDGLLKRERQTLHEHVARAIETELGHRKAELTEVLAHHWLRAGATNQAVHYLRQAGAKAIERYALDEADHFYREAYDLLTAGDRDAAGARALAETLIDWTLVHYYTGELDRAYDLLTAHTGEFAKVGDPELTGMALAWRGNAAWIAGRLREGSDLLDQAIEVGEAAGCPKVVAHAIAWKLWVLFMSARANDAVELAARLPALLEQLDDTRYLVIKSQSALGFCSAALGDDGEAIRIGDRLIALGERTGSTRAAAMGYSVHSAAASVFGDFRSGVENGRRAEAAASDPIFLATVVSALQFNLAAASDVDGLRQSIDASAEVMDRVMPDYHRAMEGICLVLENRPARGMRVLEESRHLAQVEEFDWLRCIVDGFIAVMYARLATRELDAPASVAVRNIGFVVKHGLPAKRRAHRMFEQWEADFITSGRVGLLFLISYEWAKLLAHTGAAGEARRRLEMAIAASDAHPESPGRRDAVALLESLA